MALSIEADMSRGNSPGIFMDWVNLDNTGYDSAASGSWTIGGGRMDRGSNFVISSNILNGDTVAEHSAVTKRICAITGDLR